MIYKNFDKLITRKHGIVIEGWPLQVFNNPSAIGSQMELGVLLRAWQTGANRFQRMTEDEHTAWMVNHAGSEPPSTGATDLLPAVPSTETHQDSTLPISLSVFESLFDFVSLESTTYPQARNPAPKKPWKTRSDKGKPRKKTLQIPGANVFHMSTQ